MRGPRGMWSNRVLRSAIARSSVTSPGSNAVSRCRASPSIHAHASSQALRYGRQWCGAAGGANSRHSATLVMRRPSLLSIFTLAESSGHRAI